MKKKQGEAVDGDLNEKEARRKEIEERKHLKKTLAISLSL